MEAKRPRTIEQVNVKRSSHDGWRLHVKSWTGVFLIKELQYSRVDPRMPFCKAIILQLNTNKMARKCL